MIIQMTSDGDSAFVITQIDHAATSGQFARHWGNDRFAPLAPAEPMVYVAKHHDAGWKEVDANPLLDPDTRLPYHLTKTPIHLLTKTSARSPEFNEAHHPYSGLMSSMHSYGLYHGRYGLSDKVYIDMIDESARPQVEAMLNNEKARQERLTDQLRAGEHAHLATVDAIFSNYKLLQFFDTLALYLQTQPADALTEATFLHVPLSIGDDVTVTARPVADHTIELDPWVFDVPSFEATTVGRIMAPLPPDDIPDDLGAYLRSLPTTTQTFTLREHGA